MNVSWLHILFFVALLGVSGCDDEVAPVALDMVDGMGVRGLDLERDIVSPMGTRIFDAEECPSLCERHLDRSKSGQAPAWLDLVITTVRAEHASCVEQVCGSLRDAVEGGDDSQIKEIEACVAESRSKSGKCFQKLTVGCESLCRQTLKRSVNVGTQTEGGDAAIGLAWTFSPEQLKVYRPTRVRLTLDAPPKGHENARCVWNVGTERIEGCQVSHTFENGRADEWVTLELIDGSWRWKSTKRIPLERLPVVKGFGTGPAGEGIPPAPKAKERTFRLAVIADTASKGGVTEDVTAGMNALVDQVKPHLVVHLGGLVAPGTGNAGWRIADEGIAAKLAAARIPVAWVMSQTDLKEGERVVRPDLPFIDGEHFPKNYTFSYKGAFFMVISGRGEKGIDENTLRWVRKQLARAQVYDARFVFSYLPLHKFSDAHVGSLAQKLRLYELFLRGRVNTLFSAGYRVYFKGRYGTLPVVSVGALSGPGGKLAGTTLEQPPSFAVVDVIKGVPKRVFAVEGPSYTRPISESRLPLAVEVYSR